MARHPNNNKGIEPPVAQASPPRPQLRTARRLQLGASRVAGTRRSINRSSASLLNPSRVNLQTSRPVSRQSTRISHSETSHRVDHQRRVSTHDHATHLRRRHLVHLTVAINRRLDQASTTTVLSGSLVIDRTITRKLNRAIAHSTPPHARTTQRPQAYAAHLQPRHPQPRTSRAPATCACVVRDVRAPARTSDHASHLPIHHLKPLVLRLKHPNHGYDRDPLGHITTTPHVTSRARTEHNPHGGVSLETRDHNRDRHASDLPNRPIPKRCCVQ